MHVVTVYKELNHSIETVWEVIDDFGNIRDYHPKINSSQILNQKHWGIGAERECTFSNGIVIKERITEYKPYSHYKMDIFDTGKFPIEEAFAELTVVETEPGKTKVSFTISYEPKFGAVGAMLSNIVIKREFHQTFCNILEGLEKYLNEEKIDSQSNMLLNFS